MRTTVSTVGESAAILYSPSCGSSCDSPAAAIPAGLLARRGMAGIGIGNRSGGFPQTFTERCGIVQHEPRCSHHVADDPL